MYISKVQLKNIIENAPPGTTPRGIVESLERQGHVIEGLNDDQNLASTESSSSASSDAETAEPAKKTVGGFLGNVVKSGANLVKNTAEAAVNVFNPDSQKNTLANIGRVGLGTVEKLIPGRQGAEDQADSVGQMLRERYGGWEQIKTTAYEDPVGFLLDASSVLGGVGGAVRAAGTTAKAANVARAGEVISTAGRVIDAINAVSKTARGTANLASKGVGATTGVGSTAIREGFEAAVEGGTRQKAFTSSMRNPGTGEELLGQAKQALASVKEQRAATYQKQLSTIKASKDTLDISPVQSKVDEMLTQFGVRKVLDEQGRPVLDFSRSTIGDTAEQARVQRIVDDVTNWDDFTPVGVDTLKRRIANEFSQSSDVRAFTQAIKNETRSLLKKDVPGYEQLTKSYEETSNLIDDIQSNLSLGDKAKVETGIKKLTSAMKQNNEIRMELIKQLEANGAGNLSSSIAGTAVSSIAPRGIMNPLLAAGGLYGISMAGLMEFLPALLLASPRVVGEFLNVLGTATRVSDKAKLPQATSGFVRSGTQVERAEIQ